MFWPSNDLVRVEDCSIFFAEFISIFVALIVSSILILPDSVLITTLSAGSGTPASRPLFIPAMFKSLFLLPRLIFFACAFTEPSASTSNVFTSEPISVLASKMTLLAIIAVVSSVVWLMPPSEVILTSAVPADNVPFKIMALFSPLFWIVIFLFVVDKLPRLISPAFFVAPSTTWFAITFIVPPSAIAEDNVIEPPLDETIIALPEASDWWACNCPLVCEILPFASIVK